MKRKALLAVLMSISMTCSMGFAGAASATETETETAAATETASETETAAAAETASEAETAAATEAASEAGEDADQAAADEVAALIDKIYVQERTDTTDEDCAAAKAAWDALSDAQKELVEGEEASPEYFGLDTGDASADDPRNQDEIGENELLVVSFGTSLQRTAVPKISKALRMHCRQLIRIGL